MKEWLRERWFDITIRRHTIRHKLIMWFVWKLPHDVVEIATVRTWANGTSGAYDTQDATTLTIDEALRRWRKNDGGDKHIKRDEVYY